MTGDKGQSLALLIDGDNVSPKIVTDLLAEAGAYGTLGVKRIYADWTRPDNDSWKACLLEHSIQPIQQFAYTVGKNATDSAMIIDAMDLLYTRRFSGFCLVSSDSDFVRLAVRIREDGLSVHGFGAPKTPRPFVTACDTFHYIDAPSANAVAPAQPCAQKSAASTNAVKAPPAQKPAINSKAIETLAKAIHASTKNGQATLSAVGSHLSQNAPHFNSRKLGYSNLTTLVKASGIADVTYGGKNSTVVSVSLKSDYAVRKLA
ncbi:NYN domain-containing protein [Roseivivax marinus]|uniref:NYN domain-containing protein n=1 Tax=Roseivivax marinus TaxID=1379903 RepID=UPI001F049223|nr:NYN domain-containing protein [Roseivivax marinus]UMA65136.1 NYN domain-containing protein [Roseivivax marinus]